MSHSVDGGDMGAFKDRLRKQAGDSRARETAHDPTHPARPTYPAGKPYSAPKRPDFHTRDRLAEAPKEFRIDSNKEKGT